MAEGGVLGPEGLSQSTTARPIESAKPPGAFKRWIQRNFRRGNIAEGPHVSEEKHDLSIETIIESTRILQESLSRQSGLTRSLAAPLKEHDKDLEAAKVVVIEVQRGRDRYINEPDMVVGDLNKVLPKGDHVIDSFGTFRTDLPGVYRYIPIDYSPSSTKNGFRYNFPDHVEYLVLSRDEANVKVDFDYYVRNDSDSMDGSGSMVLDRSLAKSRRDAAEYSAEKGKIREEIRKEEWKDRQRKVGPQYSRSAGD